jgi:hypothetical protein
MEYFKIEDINHLNVLCKNIEQFSCFITLAGGYARSSKYITYNEDDDIWCINHCIDDTHEDISTAKMLEGNIGQALNAGALYGYSGQGEEKFKKQEFTTVEIMLGVIKAYGEQDANDIFDYEGSDVGHTTTLVVPLDSEEGKFWGNLDVDEIDIMKHNLEKLDQKLKRSVTWSVEDFEYVAQYREKQMNVGYGYYDRSRFDYALQEMIRHHDAEIGITWISIETYLDDLCIDDKPEYWQDTWQEISFETAQKLWHEKEIFGYSCYEESESLLNDVNNDFIPEMVSQWDYLFIEKEE